MDWHTADIRRLMYCRQTSPDMSNAELARYYNFNLSFVEQQFGADAIVETKKGKRPDYAKIASDFALRNVHEELSVAEMCSVLNCSTPTAYKILDALPNYYWKVARGIWQCRNPKDDKRNDL